MKITLLGTGTSQGVPIIGCTCKVCSSQDEADKRLRCAVLVESNEATVVIDCGPDFRYQMLRAKVGHVDALLITHEHNDHVIGLDDVRPIVFRSRSNMKIYAVPRVAEEIKKRFEYAFEEHVYPGAPRFDLLPIMDEEKPIIIQDIHFQPIKVMHGELPILGFRIKDFTYITDGKTIAEKEIEKIKGTKHLVINALHHTWHHSHFNLEESLAMIEKIQPEYAYITHISHLMGLAKEVNPTLPPNVRLAFDGQTFEW